MLTTLALLRVGSEDAMPISSVPALQLLALPMPIAAVFYPTSRCSSGRDRDLGVW